MIALVWLGVCEDEIRDSDAIAQWATAYVSSGATTYLDLPCREPEASAPPTCGRGRLAIHPAALYLLGDQ